MKVHQIQREFRLRYSIRNLTASSESNGKGNLLTTDALRRFCNDSTASHPLYGRFRGRALDIGFRFHLKQQREVG